MRGQQRRYVIKHDDHAAVLALIPLLRSNFFGPMATALMGGITVATILTLFYLPALYAAWFRVRADEASERPAS